MIFTYSVWDVTLIISEHTPTPTPTSTYTPHTHTCTHACTHTQTYTHAHVYAVYDRCCVVQCKSMCA